MNKQAQARGRLFLQANNVLRGRFRLKFDYTTSETRVFILHENFNANHGVNTLFNN
jgi:hypothetical protein